MTPFDISLIIESEIPNSSTLEKAIKWQPRQISVDDKHNIDLTIKGYKPVTLTTDEIALEKQDEIENDPEIEIMNDEGNIVKINTPSTGDYQGRIIYKKQNKDIADLLITINKNMDNNSAQKHYIMGILLGYPFQNIYNWINKNIHSHDKEEVLNTLKTHITNTR